MKKDKFDQKKKDIKAAGIKTFAVYGFYKTTLEDIAGVLGMKKNSLYYYYESKEALFREIIDDEITEHLQVLYEIIKIDISADKKIIEIVSTLSEFIRQRTLKYTIRLSAYIEFGKVIRKEFSDFKRKESEIIESILKDGIKSGLFVKHDTKILAEDITNLIPAMFRNHYVDSDAEFVHEINFEEIVHINKRLINYIINGIKVKN